jgi:O-antigen ligase
MSRRKSRPGSPPSSQARPEAVTIAPSKALPTRAALYVLTCLAVALPFCVAIQWSPQPAFVTQLLAFGLWGAVLVVLLTLPHATAARQSGEKTVLGLWLVLIAGVAFSILSGRTAPFLAAPSLAVVVLALALTLCATRVPTAWRAGWLIALGVGVAVAAAYNGVVAMLQAWAPHWHDGVFIAAGDRYRAWGNLRQPNQLASLQLWGFLAALLLLHRRRIWLFPIAAFTLLVLWLSASRTGWFCVVLVAVVSVLALRPRAGNTITRRQIWTYGAAFVTIVAIAAFAFALLMLSDNTHVRPLDSTLQRLSLWRDVIALIKAEPLLGVGFGQLNFAWMLTPFTARAPDVFDHAHSLPLQLAVELGVPIAIAILVMLASSLCFGFVNRARDPHPVTCYAPLGMFGVVLTHSMVEHPLWFAYFLLPSAVLLAMWVGRSCATHATIAEAPRATQRRLIDNAIAATFALVLAIAIAWTVHGYRRVMNIYANADDSARATTLAQHAMRHWLYGYYGDFAAIMLAGDVATVDLFARPIRATLDENLLVAWSRALSRAGEYNKSAYVADRARELPWNSQFERLPPRRLKPSQAASAPLGPADFRR